MEHSNNSKNYTKCLNYIIQNVKPCDGIDIEPIITVTEIGYWNFWKIFGNNIKCEFIS